MINLLPDNIKRAIDLEYRRRRLALILFMILILVVIAIAGLLPTYILSSFRVRGVNTQILSVELRSQVTSPEFQNIVSESKKLINILKPEPGVVPSNILATLVKNKGDNSITNIAYTKTSQKTASLTVSGRAKTRQGLVAFTTALRREPGIEKVEVPVSNFAKDSEIDFSFTITAGNI